MAGKEERVMEIRTNTVELLDRQVPVSRNKDGKTEDGISGFKTLLRDKNQKKSNENTDSEEPGKDAQAALAEAAASHVNGNTPDPQPLEDRNPISGQELVKVLARQAASNEIQPFVSQTSETPESINPMQFFDLMNNTNQMNKMGNIKLFGAEQTDTLKMDTGKVSEIGLMNGLEVQIVEKKNNYLTDDKNQGLADDLIEGKIVKTDSALTGAELSSNASLTVDKEEPLVAVQNRKPKGKELIDHEDKNAEKTSGSFQEKFFEPSHVIRTEQDKDVAVSVAVNPDNLEELEAKLSEQILNQIRAGKNNLELQLEPHNLGKILLKVSYQDSQMNVSIICSESKTLKLISQSAAELGTILESNLERPIQVVVDKQEADYLNNQQQGQHNNGQGQHHQNQEKGAGENMEDFIHKLRLGFFEPDSTVSDEWNDR